MFFMMIYSLGNILSKIPVSFNNHYLQVLIKAFFFCFSFQMYSCILLFFICNTIEGQLISTGAFEVTFNGKKTTFLSKTTHSRLCNLGNTICSKVCCFDCHQSNKKHWSFLELFFFRYSCLVKTPGRTITITIWTSPDSWKPAEICPKPIGNMNKHFSLVTKLV